MKENTLIAGWTFSFLLFFVILIILNISFPVFFDSKNMAIVILLGLVILQSIFFILFVKHYSLSNPFNIIKVYKKAGWMASRMITVSLTLVISSIFGLIFLAFL